MLLALTLGETIVSDLATAIFTGVFVAGGAALVVWFFQSRRQEEEKERDRVRLLAETTRDTRLGFISATSELAGSFYFEVQRYYRQKSHTETWGDPDPHNLDSVYTSWGSRCEVLEQELGARYGEKSDSVKHWHAVRDLLTVRYFDLRDSATPGLLRVNSKDYEGGFHSGLPIADLGVRATVFAAFHTNMEKLVESLRRENPDVGITRRELSALGAISERRWFGLNAWRPAEEMPNPEGVSA
jgi:hypothetical protein